MSNPLSILDQIQVASPCPMSWGAMTGDERARFCTKCDKHVFNLSEMTTAEAEALIVEKEGRLCVRYFKRADGKVMTADCPVGWRRKIVRRVAVGLASCFAVVGLIANSVRGQGTKSPNTAARNCIEIAHSSWMRKYQPLKTICDWIDPEVVTGAHVLTGDVCIPINPRPNNAQSVPATTGPTE